MRIQFLRNATLLIEWNNKRILVDPLLGAKGSYDPVANTANEIRNPTSELPLTPAALQTVLAALDAVIVTHTHRDHWDAAAQELLPKNITLFCQPEDEEKIKGQGFTQVIPVNDTLTWEGISMHRTGGQHGTGEIGRKMAPVSGFVLNDGQNSLYIAGDTIWCGEVMNTLDTYKPTYTVVNAGAAQFVTGDPITMTANDVINVINHTARTKVIAVHMGAVNHCFLTREALAVAVNAQQLSCFIPEQGDWITLS
ncbi:MAG TPA: MBL fold metallo-hydrolase [Chitinophaga sp.]|uniref:MBL fold metallo-hydrolase n=1 Tax=Chitinophaga sp. TaxID=1869181 RepID=UPI002B712647|nr:MBL fold metallo-hydrolase [Chitinophaga sp.]HVI48598.1 MBL fold metallo-hydrolase [Chitinophaga sp.]